MHETPSPAAGGDWVRAVFPTRELAWGARALPVGSQRRVLARSLAARSMDAALAARHTALGTDRELDGAAAGAPPTGVLVLGIYQPDGAADMERAVTELGSSKHEVSFILGATGKASSGLAAQTLDTEMQGGKFANLNRLLELTEGELPEWILLIDDDVRLPGRFLDRMVGVADTLAMDLCQPALTWRSHGAWRITRRRPTLAHRTRFVEIGPVTLISREVLRAVAPFHEAGMGWGQCLHWGALAKRNGWSLGIIDALAIAHDRRRTASGYSEAEALEEARAYLAEHEHISFGEASETLATVRRLS